MFYLKFCHRYVCVVARSGYAVQLRPPLLQSACCGCRVLPYVLQWVFGLMCILPSVYGLGLHSRRSGNT